MMQPEFLRLMRAAVELRGALVAYGAVTPAAIRLHGSIRDLSLLKAQGMWELYGAAGPESAEPQREPQGAEAFMFTMVGIDISHI